MIAQAAIFMGLTISRCNPIDSHFELMHSIKASHHHRHYKQPTSDFYQMLLQSYHHQSHENLNLDSVASMSFV